MLGGIEVTARAREHARDMLAGATQPQGKRADAARAAPGAAASAPDDAAGDTIRQPRPPAARRR